MGTLIVIGAGVAGTLAARSLALQGRDVLLVERETFPRAKVCGACLGPEALGALRDAGLGDLPARLAATPLHALSLHSSGRGARLPLDGGVALSRATLDHALLRAAQDAGVRVREGVSATIRSDGAVELSDGTTHDAELVIRATGLGGGRVRRRSMLGAGAVYPRAADAFERGIIYMAHARGGYVGATVAEGGQLVAGAALRPGFVRKHGIAGGVERVLAAAGRPAFSAVDGVVWRGTPLLTRSPRRPYDGRTLFAGDTAGYVEPFTGEGIGWAMRSGLAVADLAAAGWSPGLGERWAVRRDELLRPAQARCRTLSTALRWPGAVSLAVRTLRLFPSIAPRLVQKTTAWASPS